MANLIISLAALLLQPIGQEDNSVIDSRWLLVASDLADDITLLDTLSIDRQGQLVTAWTRTNWSYVAADGVTYSLHRYRYDCSARTYQLVAVSHFSRNGMQVRREPQETLAQQLRFGLPGPIQHVVPETIAERVFLHLCSR